MTGLMKSLNLETDRATLPGLLETWAGRQPGSPAIMDLGGRPPLSYRGLYDHLLRTASALRRLGVGRNDRVAIVLPSGPEMATAFLSVSACATSAPLNPAYRAEEFDFYFSDLKAKALLVEAGCASVAADVARVRSIPVIELRSDASAPAGSFAIDSGAASAVEFAAHNDVAMVLHTSGTTSRPKIVPLTQANLMVSAKNVAQSLALTESDRCLNVMPLFHIHGLVAALLASLWSGGSVVATPGFNAPRFLDWMEEHRPTWYTAVPTMHQSILSQAGKDPARIERCRPRFVRSCSAPLAPKLMAELEGVLQAPVIEAYGMTEAAHQMTSNPLPPRQRKPGSVGVAAGPEVSVMDSAGNLVEAGQVGEVVIRGPNVTAGYENNPSANSASFVNGWFRTGDQGVLDGEGYLTLTGRLKEIINRGGEKIMPREIDEALLDHPAVAQAVAFAIPDPRLGEDLGVAIVLRPGSSVTVKELQEFAAAHLAEFKVPRKIVFLDEVPKGPTGKQQRIGLAERLGIRGTGEERPRERAPFEPPASDLEKQLASIWKEVLKVDRVGRRDDFLQLGGDSILAALVASRIRDRLGVQLTVVSLFSDPTVEQQAAWIVQVLRRTAPE
jgi:oxalate---CoA ligase